MSRSRRGQHNHEEHIDETWLIPYADLLTLLLALFIVLFASSQVDQTKFKSLMEALNQALSGGIGVMENPAPITPMNDASMKPSTEVANKSTLQDKAKQNDLKALKAQVDKYIIENQLSAKVATHLNKETLLIEIREYALFDSGSALIKPESKKLGGALSKLLEGYEQYEIMVAGHTDNQPIRNSQYKSNWNLSTDRALNFMEVLLSNQNLSPKKFRAVGFGEQRPIDRNDTETGRSKNRRVEISIF